MSRKTSIAHDLTNTNTTSNAMIQSQNNIGFSMDMADIVNVRRSEGKKKKKHGGEHLNT